MSDQTTPQTSTPLTTPETEIKITVSNGCLVSRNPNTREFISLKTSHDGKVEMWLACGQDDFHMWLTEAQVEAMARFFTQEV